MSRYIKSSHLRHDTFHSVVVYNLALLSLTWYGLVGLRLCQHPPDRVGLFQTGPSFLWRAFVHLVIRSDDHTTKKRSSRFIKTCSSVVHPQLKQSSQYIKTCSSGTYRSGMLILSGTPSRLSTRNSPAYVLRTTSGASRGCRRLCVKVVILLIHLVVWITKRHCSKETLLLIIIENNK